MDGMRTLLIIVGVVVILAALGHGLWSVRKNNQSKSKNNSEFFTQKQRDVTGFDEDGIGAVRTVSAPSAVEHKRAPSAAQWQGTSPVTSSRTNAVKFSATEKTNTTSPAIASEPTSVQDEKSVQVKTTATSQAALFSEEEIPSTPVASPSIHRRKEPSMAVEQLPIAFNEDDDAQAPRLSATEIADDTNHGTDEKTVTPQIGSLNDLEEPAVHTEIEKQEPEVITLYVSGDIQGAILLQTVTELGFKFGEMDIFHRHEDTTGKGPSIFSLADMYNPGVFHLDEIETFTTRGVALFMVLPVPGDGHKAFTMMYNAANKIAEAMPRAAVLDSNRNPITKQSVQHTYQKIREFERRHHVADAARHL